MTQPSSALPVDLSVALERVRRRWRRTATMKAAARALVAMALALATAAVVERVFALSDAAALALAGAAVVAVAVIAILFGRTLTRRPSDRQVARFLEERHPACGDAVVTAVDVAARGRATDGFAPLVIAAAVRTLSTLDLDAAVDPSQSRRTNRRGLAGAVACLLALICAAPLLDRAFDVAFVRLFPSSLTLAVVPGDLRVAVGRPATIVATVSGRVRALAHVQASITLDASGTTVTVPMERAGAGYRFTLPAVDRSFHYIVSAGPAVSRAYAVTALHPPRVARIDLQYDFPSFTGLPPRLDQDSGDVYAPAGTRVRVIVHADHSVREGRLEFSQGNPAAPLTRVDARTMAASLTLGGDGAYRVGLVDADGLASDSVEYFLRVMDDRPPEIHILRPGNDEGITPLQEVPIEARADDDYGIARMDLVYAVAGGAERIVPLTSLSGSERARVGSHLLAAEDLKVKPGDVISYYARAWDVPRGKASTLARSEIFFLEVKPFNEEYSMAQSQAAMQAATGTQLDALISAQKEIISATWNIERRSGAGRSAADINGVADAQAELKGRAERAAAAQRERRRSGDPAFAIAAAAQAARRRQPRGDGDPVLAAVDAMGSAAQELQGQKTAAALPHEMAALNALLQAQADIRRQQVTEGQASRGGGWGNRQDVDLSSLFDRELKRQQRTNYENQPAVESTAEQGSGESALDKIRDLARRQEELTRRQRELAASRLPADEATRQLETLTRQQEELRRRLEDAARGAQRARDLEDALQQMREAAAQGQRADPAGAAAKGQQAADALRRAEGRLENGSADARTRALGDLQLESQQIAQAQQRIADEADRLDREGGGATDARRRLAGDKDALADRVDALARTAAGLPATAEAARDLAAQKLGDRMRASARQLRAGAGKTAPAEQQIADALDRVARKIGAPDAGGAGGPESADTGQLGGDLDRVRDARDRIARLERQMRDLQQRAGRGAQGSQPAASAGVARGAAGGADANAAADLQQQLDRELTSTRDLLERLQHADPAGGRWATPEQHEWSHSAPGTEAFKQDYARWQSLASDVTRALERAESSAASRLSSALSRDRLRAGGSERVPDAYRRQVARYFEAIAAKPGGGAR